MRQVHSFPVAKSAKNEKASGGRSIQNRKARFNYAIEDESEAGIVLQGSEVKSIFLGNAHLNDAYCRVENGELFLFNMDIEPYEKASVFAHDRRRDRKLLMKRREINVLERKALEKGYALIPLAVYFNEKGKVKVKVGLGRGKSFVDKRETIAKNDARREIEREMGRRG